MVSDMAVMAIGFGALLVFFIGIAVWIYRRNSQDWKTIELNQPLVIQSEGRAEEAKAIAKKGSSPCTTCGFDNFAHLELCAVCGDVLGDAKTRKKIIKKRAKQATANGINIRAPRRNEWIRKSDVEGKFYWYRGASTDSQSNSTNAPAFVPRFADVKTTGTEPTTSPSVQWVPSSSANPLDFPLGDGVVTGLAATLVPMAQQPFPTKYTEFVERATALTPVDATIRLRLSDLASPKTFEQSMAQLSALSPNEVRHRIAIEYAPSGSLAAQTHNKTMDWHREWLSAIHVKLADPATGLFVCVNHEQQTYHVNPDSLAACGEHHLTYLFAVGRMLGRHFIHGDLLSFHLSRPLLKVLLGQPFGVEDLEHFDLVVYKSLQRVLSTPNAESLTLDFTMTERTGDAAEGEASVSVVELVPNGRNIAVTDANKHEYVTRVAQYVMVERVASQLASVCRGFYSVVPQELLVLVSDAEELDYLLCGVDDIDVDDWERHTKFDMYLFEEAAMKYFWRFVREMPVAYQRNLLHFATGLRRVPLGGFAALKSWDGRLAPFSLQGVDLVDGKYLKSDPCFNRLTLPKVVLEHKMLRDMMWTMFDPEMYPTIIATWK